jgi:hypothetical protein
MRPVKRRHGQSFVKIDGSDVVDGMNKDNGFATIKLFPDRDILRVSEISLRSGIASEQGNSICFEHIKSIAYLLEDKIGMLKRWKCSKKAVGGVFVAKAGGVIIHFASYLCTFFGVGNVSDSRSADRVYD